MLPGHTEQRPETGDRRCIQAEWSNGSYRKNNIFINIILDLSEKYFYQTAFPIIFFICVHSLSTGIFTEKDRISSS